MGAGVETHRVESDRRRFRSQEENHMSDVLSRIGLRYKEKAIDLGAQTERRVEGCAAEGSARRRYLSGYLVSWPEDLGVS